MSRQIELKFKKMLKKVSQNLGRTIKTEEEFYQLFSDDANYDLLKPILEKYRDNWKEGDAIIVNSPRAEYGGTHLPDISLVSPVFVDGKLQYIVANRAHHAYVGGMTPGSLPGNSTEVYQEGLQIPPVRIYNQGIENIDIMEIILENVRTPDERRGDLRAQYASLTLGVNRLKDLVHREDWNFNLLGEALLDFSEKGTLDILRELPDGEASFSDYLDSDGNTDDPVKSQEAIIV